MPEIVDVFSGNAFTAVSLTSRVNNTPYVPNFLASLPNTFEYDGVRTVDVAFEELNGAIEIIETSERGEAPKQADNDKRKIRKASCQHIAQERKVMADEVQSVIAMASDPAMAALQTPEALIYERLEGPTGLRQAIELTHEYYRLGQIQGIVVDKDPSKELFNWYTFFGISALTANTTNFGALTVDGGVFEVECAAMVRAMVKELEGLVVTNMRPVALCGDNYYDQVYSNKEVKAARKNRDTGRDSDVFLKSKAYSSLDYGGITFVNYRGSANGDVGIHIDKARLFPTGVPGLFPFLFGPPDIMGLTNTKGLPVYAFMPPERQTSRMAVVEGQSNMLPGCRRPRALRSLLKS